jgi:hypothetical protein
LKRAATTENWLRLAPLVEKMRDGKQLGARALARINVLAWELAILQAKFEPLQEPLMHITVHLIERMTS